jgi:Glyoxalase/Bleomycin resistance protein/Dioxygenase superfamily
MSDEDLALPAGMGGLRYPITQISLVVEDIDALLARYHRFFGWAPWQDFDHVPPMHRNAEYRSQPVEYSLRGAEVYVGSLNFELLYPIPGGTSLFHDHLAAHGEGICSIASMFHEREDGDLVKQCFRDRFGLEVINKADIGEHIEYYYVDTQADFGCPIESGSGHAIDFEGPARVFPNAQATFGPSPDSGITYRIAQVTLVVNDLDAKVANFGAAFGWGPWRIFDTDQPGVLANAAYGDKPVHFRARFAQAMVGDINFEIVQPSVGASPWQDFLERRGEGLMGIAVAAEPPATAADVVNQFGRVGIGELASGDVGDGRWTALDAVRDFKIMIAVAPALAFDTVDPRRTVDRR